MKQTIILKNWELFCAGEKPEEIFELDRPQEVQEALIRLGAIPNSVLEDGDSLYCNWIQQKDWVYRTTFIAKAEEENTFLCFNGIDTVADIFINGNFLGRTESVYMEYRFEITEYKKEINILEIYVHSPEKMLNKYEEEMPESWKGEVSPYMMLRKGRDYGTRFGFMPIGIFGDVELQYTDCIEIKNLDYRIKWNLDFTEAQIFFEISHTLENKAEGTVFIRIQEKGGRCWEAEALVEADGMARNTISIQNPLLWWPKNYGGQPLYEITVQAYCKGILCDERKETTGFRSIRRIGDMRFEINGKEIYLWGAGITPICGISHSYHEEYVLDMLDKLDQCNMNAVRVWGPGKANPEQFYEELDKKGILVWQDFPTGTWQMPDNEKYKEIYSQEADWMVRRLKHHPSVLMWCGGNEHIYMCELDEKKTRIGFDMLHNGYREICQKLDPDRYYHVSCPYEGKYTNDPSYGDSHGSRAYCAYTPGEDYGVFFSEDIRVFPPEYKSALRFMKDDIWDENYIDCKTYGTEYAMPEGWKNHFSNNGHLKLGPIREFYDASTPAELIYKYAAAAAQDLYQIGAYARTGNPEHAMLEKRKRIGHFFWKFNDTWPRFYCAFYDYYQECTLPYYSVKRVFSPFLLHLAVKDHIYLWGVNDTAKNRSGEITIKLFHMLKNKVLKEIKKPAAYPSGSSIAVCLDEIGPINWNCILYAEMEDESGEKTRAQAFVTQENMLAFPQAELTVELTGNQLTITTDCFARCIELSGVTSKGNEFGWYFEDNYFDLLPFEIKSVTVDTKHILGTIYAKPHYSIKASKVEWQSNSQHGG